MVFFFIIITFKKKKKKEDNFYEEKKNSLPLFKKWGLLGVLPVMFYWHSPNLT
jgi:hypothetical protein